MEASVHASISAAVPLPCRALPLAGMTYRDLRPDNVRPVQVQLDDGTWVDGWVEVERKVEGVWQGWVRYSVTREHTETFIGWFEVPRIRGHT